MGKSKGGASAPQDAARKAAARAAVRDLETKLRTIEACIRSETASYQRKPNPQLEMAIIRAIATMGLKQLSTDTLLAELRLRCAEAERRQEP